MTDTRTQKTKKRKPLKKRTHKREKNNDNTEQQEATPEPTNLAETTQLNLRKELHHKRCEDLQHRQVAKHPLDQPTTTAKHPSEARSTNNNGKASVRRELQPATAAAKHPPAMAKYPPTKRWAAKHPPTDDQRDLDDVEKTKRRQVQKWILFEKRIRPPPAGASKTTPPGRERRKRRRCRLTKMV
jgi:hypothetical protein